MPGGKSGMFPGIERMHQSEEYKQWQAEDAILRDIGRDRLVELAKAERDCRLVVLPCKVGDIAYLPLRDGIHAVRVKGIRISASGKDTVIHLDIGSGEFRWGSDKGRTWFATHQEAEAAASRITQ